MSLTLGAHTPQGYGTWSVCVSVCLCVRHHESCHYAQRSVQPKVPTASAQSGKRFKYGVFSKIALFKSYGVKKPTSLRAYRDIIWRRWSDISPEIWAFSGSFKVLTAGYKLPGVVRQRASLSAVQFVQGFCFCSLPYTFCYMFVNACAFSQPHARATAL